MAVARSSERYFVLARSAIFKMIAALRRKGGEEEGRRGKGRRREGCRGGREEEGEGKEEGRGRRIRGKGEKRKEEGMKQAGRREREKAETMPWSTTSCHLSAISCSTMYTCTLSQMAFSPMSSLPPVHSQLPFESAPEQEKHNKQ